MLSQRPPVAATSGTAFSQGDIIKVSSGTLTRAGSSSNTGSNGDTAIWGVATGPATASTDTPPDAFFGANQYAIDIRDAIIEMNVCGTTRVEGGSAYDASAVAVGKKARIVLGATSTTTQLADVETSDGTLSTVGILTYLGPAPGQSTSDKNFRGLFSVAASAIQA